MFEKEIKFISDLTSNQIKALGNYISIPQLQAAGVHPAIICYLEGEIDFLIFEDRQNLLKNSTFDYYGDRIDELFNAINAEIKKNKKFSQEYILKLVLHAVSFNVNFLTRPNWTLSRFLFDDGDEKSVIEIKQILKYLYYYDYLKNIILSYLSKKKIISLSKDELNDLFAKIDSIGIGSNYVTIIENMINSMSDFFNYQGSNKNLLPANAIESWFSDKALQNLWVNFSGKIKSNDKNWINQQELYKIVKNESENGTFIEIEYKDSGHSDKNNFFIEEEIIMEHSEPVKKDFETEEEKFDISDHSSITDNGVNLEAKEDKNSAIINDSEILSDSVNLSEENIPDSMEKQDEENLSKTIIGTDQEVIDDAMNLVNIDKEENAVVLSVPNDIQNNPVVVENEVDLMPVPVSSEDQQDLFLIGTSEKELDSAQTDISGIAEASENPVEEIKNTDSDPISEMSEINNLDYWAESDINFEENLERSAEKIKTEIDIVELLEHKKMPKVIEEVFDYDMEEFSNLIERISECSDAIEAIELIDDFYRIHQVRIKSKEAENFKDVIREFFKGK